MPYASCVTNIDLALNFDFSELFELSCDGGFKISTNVTCFENEYSSLLNTFSTSFFVSGDSSRTIPIDKNDTKCFAQSSPSFYSNNLWTNSSYYFTFDLGFHDCGAVSVTRGRSDISCRIWSKWVSQILRIDLIAALNITSQTVNNIEMLYYEVYLRPVFKLMFLDQFLIGWWSCCANFIGWECCRASMYLITLLSHYQTLQSGLHISAFPQTPMECTVNTILELEGEQGKIEIDRNWYYFILFKWVIK